MTAEQWNRIKTLLDEALDCEAGDERAAFLDDACAGDTALRSEVDSLLAAHDSDTLSFLSGGAFKDDAGFARAEAAFEEGARVGPYRLAGVLGRGGMGTVYCAVRADGQHDREVALKVIRPGLVADDVVRRFRAERQILASLEHPHIARLYDGGLTDDGHPYFAMERVKGTPLHRHCDEKKCSIEERLRLVEKAAGAVAHAHRRLVVHRDLKPSNVLITPKGEPKLLDFGIAKLLDDEAGAGEDAPITRTGQHLMTPEYAAPEQVRGEAATPATDVYALGVVLYELLTGRRPYHFEKSTPSHVERVICETQPERPSTVVSRIDDGETPGKERTASLPHTGRLKRRLKGDLDRIILKALRKEPERRYATAAELAEDLRRHREGLPVTARPSTWRYRTGKFVRRHRWGVAVAAVLALLLVGYTATVTMQSRRLAAERDRAQVEAQKAAQVSGFLTALFEANDPNEARGDTLTAPELLRRGAERAGALAEQPAVQAQMFSSIGRAYSSIGRYERAQGLLDSAFALQEQLHTAPHLDLAQSLYDRGSVLEKRGRFATAESLHTEALAMRSALLPKAHVARAASLNKLGRAVARQRRPQEADSLLREALAIYREHPGTEVEQADVLNLLGIVFSQQERYDEAIVSHERALSIRRKALGENHHSTASSMTNLATLYKFENRLDEAEQLLRRALKTKRELLGENHQNLSATQNNLASLLERTGRYEEAGQLYQSAYDLNRKTLGSEHRRTIYMLDNLAGLNQKRGRQAEAEAQFRHALRAARERLGPGHPYIARRLTRLASLLAEQQRNAEAEHLYRQALDILRGALPEDHPDLAGALTTLGTFLLNTDRPRQATPMLREGLAIRNAAFGADHPSTATSNYLVGECLTVLGQYAEAEQHLLESHRALKKSGAPGASRLLEAPQRLAALYDAWGKPGEAAAWRDSLRTSPTTPIASN